MHKVINILLSQYKVSLTFRLIKTKSIKYIQMDITKYYNNLDDEAKKAFRTNVCDKLSIAYPTFYYRIRNNYRWKQHEIEIIKNIIYEIQ